MNRRLRRSNLNTAYVFFIPCIWDGRFPIIRVSQNVKIRNDHVNPKCNKRVAAQKRHS